VTGKLLGLDEETLVNTFGIVYHQAGGNMQCIHDGGLSKRMGPGFAVRNGIIAALMARKGITGAKNVLEGRHGFFNVYHRGEYNPEILTANFGERYEMIDLSFKRYPCCRGTHSAIDATLSIVSEHKIKAENVEAVTVNVNRAVMEFLCEPLNIKRNPRTIVDAQFSIPWTIAWAVTHGKVGIDGFTEQAIRDKTVLALSNKVTAEVDEIMDTTPISPAIVEIRTKDGKVYSKRVDKINIYGSPQNPMSMDVCAEKFKDCASHAVRRVKKDSMAKLIELLYQLETVRDVKQITLLLNWSK
jgi:2-methylcitrate dehydratase PrpD